MCTGVWCPSAISISVNKCGYLYVCRGLVSKYNLYICIQVWISVCVQGSGVPVQSLYLYTSVDIYVYRGLVSQYNLCICIPVWISVCVQGSGVPVQSLYLCTSVDICMCTGVWCPSTISIKQSINQSISVYQCRYLYVYRGLVFQYNLYICIQVWISVCVQGSGVPVQSLYLYTSVDICMCTGVWCPDTISISVYQCGYLYVYRGLVSHYNLYICVQVWISVQSLYLYVYRGLVSPYNLYICMCTGAWYPTTISISVCVQGPGIPLQSLYLYVYRGLVSPYNLYICMCTGAWYPTTISISVFVQGPGIPLQSLYLYVYRGLVSQYTRQIYILLFQRLQSSKTTKYIKSKFWVPLHETLLVYLKCSHGLYKDILCISLRCRVTPFPPASSNFRLGVSLGFSHCLIVR